MILYVAIFTEAPIAGGYIGEHYYCKTGSVLPEVTGKLVFSPESSMQEHYNQLKRVVREVDCNGLNSWIDTTINPPTLSTLLTNNALGGEALGQIVYFIRDKAGNVIESGQYLAGEILHKKGAAL